jgi:hypothetical protein
VADHVLDRIRARQRCSEYTERRVLRVGVGHLVAALELDANGKIVAMRPPAPGRHARVPRAAGARNELQELAAAPYEEVGRNSKIAQALVVRVPGAVEGIAEQADHVVAAKLARRQADVVDHDQPDRLADRAVVAIRRCNKASPGCQAARVNPAGKPPAARRSPAVAGRPLQWIPRRSIR